MELHLPDKAVSKLVKIFKTDEVTFNRAVKDLKLMSNFSGRIEERTYIAKNGERFSYDPVELKIDGLRLLSVQDHKATINGFLMTDFQRRMLISTIREDTERWNLWSLLPHDVFIKIIEDNGLRGKDLMSLCVSNPVINQKCNWKDQELFRRLLLKEYGVQSEGNHRKNYLKHSKERVWYIVHSTDHYTIRGLEVEEDMLGVSQLSPILEVVQLVTDVHNIYARDRKGAIWNVRDAELLLDVGAIDFTTGNHHIAYLDSRRRLWTSMRGMTSFLPPRLLEGFEGITSIGGGTFFIAFLDLEGQVWTFGKQRWENMRVAKADAEMCNVSKLPAPPNLVSLKCGGNYITAIDKEGRLWTFGENRSRVLGYGQRDATYLEFSQVPGVRRAKKCGTSILSVGCVTERGDLWTFGNNTGNKLSRSDMPTIDVSPLVVRDKVKDFAVSNSYSAIIDVGNTLWYCGEVISNRLGHAVLRTRQFDAIGVPDVKQVACAYKFSAYLK